VREEYKGFEEFRERRTAFFKDLLNSKEI